ncbi:MAG: Formamidopyrimidine-DNA glycosylase [Parcubacteria group bacterium GW2011_GWC1_38_17]|nr:MAG: Formamidopyrimidine-DNA glycosylase [Parcubacteria group bacterium GW2011_GWC2_36_17]KKQ42673.1 MAG: Formamidopyrimidine-DNA glycosylase [Parcubacteria group bacterium GW2011_GWE2_37_8]KKQ58738.1 MAG: Formamidopyrimidine-DNA glycosylase [Parcubacteria group bacterium GW2011_GWC1_38_17]
MPELPEVETISKDLNKKIPGLKIRDFWTDFKAGKGLGKNIQLPPDIGKFKKEIISRKILKVYRKGKNILIDLSGGKLLLIHQKMTGHLLVGKWQINKVKSLKLKVQSLVSGEMQEKVNNYIHAIFYLSNGRQLALSDLRKFAKIMAGDKDKIEALPDLKNLGPDPLELTEKEFVEILNKQKGKIKQILMDQEILSGIGNIYSDEILWFAKIHPFARVEKLSNKNLKNIYKYTRQVLKEAIKLRGASISDYRDPEGKSGGYDKIRRVYRREGEKCPSTSLGTGLYCNGIIKRIKIGGRSAHFCSKCQKL